MRITGAQLEAFLEQSARYYRVDASGRVTPFSNQMGVVLPGGAKRWKAAGSSGLVTGSDVQLSIRSATGETRHNVVLESR